MTLAQLEADRRTQNAKIATLIENTSRALEGTKNGESPNGRPMTAEERGAIDAACAEGETIQAKIDALRGDDAVLARVRALRESAGPDPAHPAIAPARGDVSIGYRFATSPDVQAAIKSGLFRSSQPWTVRGMESAIPWAMHGTTITEDPASGGALVVPQYLAPIHPQLFRPNVVADLMAPGTTNSNAVISMVESGSTNAAAPVAEGGVKPESALVFIQRTDPVVKIATWLPATEELLEDVPAMASYIDGRLQLGVQLAEDDQLLNGNGTPPNLAGIMNRAGLAPAVARNAGATPAESNAEAILRQNMAIATTAYVYPSGIVMNPTNWFTTITMKDGSGQFFGGGPFSPLPTSMLWGLPVAVTPAIVAGTALVGAFSSMAQVFRRGGITVAASNSHQDFFTRNLIAIRAEERLALAVYRPGAFGKVTGLS